MSLKGIVDDLFRKKTKLDDDEHVIKSGIASMQRGLESVGGTLTVTSKRIIFDPHVLNLQRDSVSIDGSEVNKVSKSRSKFLNVVDTIDNAITIETGKDSFLFSVYKRDDWLDAIENSRNAKSKLVVSTPTITPNSPTQKP